MGPRGFARRGRRRGRRRGLIVGAAIGSAAARRNNNGGDDSYSQEDPIAELEKLGELRDQGILTEEEFSAKKSQILDM